jgi:hypothetical protein
MPFPEGDSITPSGFGLSFIITSLNFSLIIEFKKALFKAQFTRYNPLNQCWGQRKNEPNAFSGQAAFETAMALREACL